MNRLFSPSHRSAICKNIRVFCLIVCLSPFTFTNANAQIAVNYGVKAGFNIAGFYDSSFESENLTGLNAGAFFEFESGRIPVSVQPEINYSRRGAKSTWLFDDIAVRGTFKMDYVELPLLIKYSPKILLSVKPYIAAGPSLNILIRSEFETEDQFVLDLKEATHSTEINVTAAAGFNFHLKNRTMFTEIKYNRGFSEIFEPQASLGGGDGTHVFTIRYPQKHSLFSIVLGLRF